MYCICTNCIKYAAEVAAEAQAEVVEDQQHQEELRDKQKLRATRVEKYFTEARATRLGRGGTAQGKFESFEQDLVRGIQKAMELAGHPTLTPADVKKVLHLQYSHVRKKNTGKELLELDLAAWFKLKSGGEKKIAEQFFDMHYVDRNGDGLIQDEELAMAMQYISQDYIMLLKAHVDSLQQMQTRLKSPPQTSVRVTGHLDPVYNGVYALSTDGAASGSSSPRYQSESGLHLYRVTGTNDWVFNYRYEPQNDQNCSAFVSTADGELPIDAVDGAKWTCYDGVAEWKGNVTIALSLV